jgi:prepilin-type N-terminal cleavage/methylation domain-containing protein
MMRKRKCNCAVCGPLRLRAFTLIELLIVVVILGMLMALMLPSVQGSREATRRSSCQNNLRQVGIALMGYNDSMKSFPHGAKHTAVFGVSWVVRVYPFLEGTRSLSDLNTEGAYAGYVLKNPSNGKLIDNLRIPTLYCTSSPLEPLLPVGAFQVFMPSYVGVSGASSHDGFNEDRVSACCDPRNNGEISGGGILIPNQKIFLRQVVDGVSNVLAVGETSTFAFDFKGRAFRVDGGHGVGWITGTSVRGVPPKYAEPFASWNLTTVRYPPNTSDYSLPGIETDHGPNNPFNSAHPGSVNAVTADGSLKSLSNSIDLTVLKALATRDDGGVGH